MTNEEHYFYRFMKQKNRYIIRAKISEKRFRTFLRSFAAGLSTRIIAKKARMNRNTVNKLALEIRSRMAEDCIHGDSAAIRLKAGEKFWRYVKLRFARIKRVHKRHAHLHLKECEWRYAHKDKNVYAALLAMLRKRPIRYS